MEKEIQISIRIKKYSPGELLNLLNKSYNSMTRIRRNFDDESFLYIVYT